MKDTASTRALIEVLTRTEQDMGINLDRRHPSVELIAGTAEGGLSPATAAAIRKHAEVCPVCAKRLEVADHFTVSTVLQDRGVLFDDRFYVN